MYGEHVPPPQDDEATPLSADRCKEPSSSVPLLKKQGTCKVTLVDTDAKRSTRIQKRNEGFKTESSCPDRHCVACHSAPPELNDQTIKNLGNTICKMAPEEIYAEALGKKRRSMLLWVMVLTKRCLLRRP